LHRRKRLLSGELPQTISDGIGPSRPCMLFLQKLHVGEMQCSVWPQEMREPLKKATVAPLQKAFQHFSLSAARLNCIQ
jgi:asparagine synthetase A